MRILPAALVAILALGAAACGGASTPSSPSTAAPSVEPVAVADPDALVRDAANLDGKPVKVSGFFLASDGTARLCSVVLESYPPQCGGGAVAVTGEVPPGVMDALDSTSEPDLAQATWGWVEIVGTFAAAGDGGPSLAISSIRLAAP